MAKAKKVNMRPEVDGYNAAHTVKVPLWPYLVAPLSCVAAYLFTLVVHHYYTQDPQMAGWSGFVIGVMGIVLLGFTALAARPRGVVMQVMASTNCLLGWAWVAPAIINGPWSLAMGGLWLAGAVYMTVTAAVYRIMRQARGDQQQGVIEGELGEMADAVKSLKNVARFGKPVIEGARVTQSITMKPGASFSEIEETKKNLASLHDVPVTAIRTVADPDSERRGKIIVVPRDQLREPVADPGLSHPGGSVADPLVLGRTEDGSDLELILPGDPTVHRNAVGVMGLVGMSGSGKTELLLRFCKELITRHDSHLHIADARKIGQLPRWLKRAAKSVTGGPQDTLELLEGMELSIAQRAEWLGSRGFKQWVRGCGLPFETYIIFEANAILSDSNVVNLAESVRSVGICLVLESQRATFDRFPTSARSNVTTWLCLGVQKPDDAEAALSESTMDAGAAPWKWKNHKPGYVYLEWAGRDEELWSAPNRAFIEEEEDRARQVEEYLSLVGGSNPEPTTGAEVVPAVRTNGDRPDPEPEPEPEGEPEVRPGVDPDDPPPDTDPAEPIRVPPGLPDIEFGDSVEKMTSKEALSYLRSHVFDLAAAGKQSVQPKELSTFIGTTGMSPGWIYPALQRLSQGPDACLRKVGDGHYRILKPEPIGAGAGGRGDGQ